MSDTFDRFRSLLRSTAQQTKNRLAKTSLGALRKRLRDLVRGRLVVADSSLNSELARAPHVSSVTTACVAGSIHVDAAFNDGSSLVVALRPTHITFAMRGAKEITFSVEPPSAATDARTATLVGAVAAAIARTVWSPILDGADLSQPILDRENGNVRIDLRSIAAVRTQLAHPVLGPFLDALFVSGIEATRGELVLTLRLPIRT